MRYGFFDDQSREYVIDRVDVPQSMTNYLMAVEFRPLWAVLVSLTASGLIYVLGEHIHRNVREGITLTAAVLKIIIVYSMIPYVLAEREIKLELFSIVKGVSFAFNVDAAGMVFAFIPSDTCVDMERRTRLVIILHLQCACAQRQVYALLPI